MTTGKFPLAALLWLAAALGSCLVPPLARAVSSDAPVSPGPSSLIARLEELRSRIDRDNRSHPVDAVACAEEGLRLLKEESRPEDEIWFLLALVRDLRMTGDYRKAQACVERARPLVARSGTANDRFQLEVGFSALLLDQERYSECRAVLDPLLLEMEARAVEAPNDSDTRRAFGNACRIYGAVQGALGAVEDGIGLYRKAQTLYAEIGDRRGQGWVLDQMATLYMQLKRFDEAEHSSLQAVAQAEALGSASLEGAFRVGLSSVYAAMDDRNRQLTELKKAAQLAEQAKDASLTLTITANLADVYLKQHNYPASLQCSEAALRLVDPANDASTVASCQVNRGIALNRMGMSAEGIRSIQQALDHFTVVQSKPRMVEIEGILAEEYAFAGDYRKAYEAQVRFKALDDALFREEDRRHIAAASAGFESDRKQMQIDMLQRERHHQSRLRLLSIAVGGLGLAIAAITIMGRRKVRELRGLIPICSYCKKIRNDEGYWNQVEQHIQRHPKAKFSHGICPECEKRVLEEWTRSGQV